jgi:hypothetical protein
LQTWNRIKKLTPIPLPAIKSNVFGGRIIIFGAAAYYEMFYETPGDVDSCNALASMFDPSMEGISSQAPISNAYNPICNNNPAGMITNNTVRIRLD